jgi:hypothetical protein
MFTGIYKTGISQHPHHIFTLHQHCWARILESDLSLSLYSRSNLSQNLAKTKSKTKSKSKLKLKPKFKFKPKLKYK